jgi:hypothetical protein
VVIPFEDAERVQCEFEEDVVDDILIASRPAADIDGHDGLRERERERERERRNTEGKRGVNRKSYQ